MKFLKPGILGLLVVSAILVVSNWQQLAKLHDVTTLFDKEHIVSNFVNMREILPAKEVKASGEPSRFQKNLKDIPQSFEYNGVQRSTNAFLKDTNTTALLVLNGSEITHEAYLNGTKSSDYRIAWSVSKSFMSALIGVAVQEGKIKELDVPVTQYVPSLKGSGYDGVTLKNVLQMSSGVGFNEDYGDFFSDINRMGRLIALGGSFDEFTASLESERQQGSQMHYVSMDTHVLGMVLRAVTGESIVDYFDKHLWSRIQPESSAYYIVDDTGEPMVFGGLNMVSRDFLRFGKLYRDNGIWNGEQVISEQWIKDSITPDAPHLLPGRDATKTTLGYGYQWWIPENSDQEFLASGVYDQFIYVNQKENVVIVKNSANVNFSDNNRESRDLAIAFFREVVGSLASVN